MICATIFDHLAEIQAHYQCEHLETIATDDKNFESNDIIDYENDDFDDDDDDGEEEEEEILDNSSLSASYDQLNCNFSIDYGVELNSEPDGKWNYPSVLEEFESLILYLSRCDRKRSNIVSGQTGGADHQGRILDL